MSDWFPERPRPGGPQRDRRLWSFGEQPAQNREKIVIHAVLYSAGALVCGVVRDSVDRLGRPYPLLVLGTGSLREWESHWDLLPYACLPVWQRIEYLGASSLRWRRVASSTPPAEARQ